MRLPPSEAFPHRIANYLILRILGLAVAVLATGDLVAIPPVLVEMEEGAAGEEMVSITIAGAQGLAPLTNGAGTSPGSSARVTSLTVDFPEPGVYQLYARLYVGSESGDDDSFFYGAGFGEKDPAREEDWVVVNQLAFGVGSTAPEDFVPGLGSAGSEVWKWVMLSGFDGGELPIDFLVTEGGLTQTLQIGAREDGLVIDKLAFGRDGYHYTVENLDLGEPGQQTTPLEPHTPSGPPLAEQKWKWLGSVHSPSQLEGFAAYWNQVTPENAGKWGSVEGSRGAMNWSGLDAAYAFAEENGFPFRFHVLIWGAQQPEWINALSPAEQREEIEEWMAAVAERYPRIDYLEVVNEPLHQAPDGGDTGVVSGRANYVEALGGRGDSGWDWVLTSFRLARRYFPATPLVINEYGIIGSAESTNRYLELVDLLMAEELVDIIAFQAHAFSTRVPVSVLRENLDTLASRGLPIMVTEMDVDGPNDVSQLADYQSIFPVFWEHPSVIGVTLWGFRPGMWRSEQGAYLVMNNGAERPALVWLRDYVRQSAYPNFNGYLEQEGLAPERHAFESDADGDGWPTGVEYLLGADPERSDARPWLRWGLPDELSVLIRQSAREGRLELQSSEDLERWTSEASYHLDLRKANGLRTEALDQDGLRLIYEAPPEDASHPRYFRLKYAR